MEQQEKIHQALAESGEELAKCAGAVAAGNADFDMLFAATQRHMRVLNGAGLPQEAFATGVMSLITAFRLRFSPTKYAVGYLQMLLNLAVAGAMSQQLILMQGDRFAEEHFQAISDVLGPLVLATYSELDGANVLPKPVCEPFEQLADWVDLNVKFHGETIRAALALDILCDIAARLSALGLIEQDF